MTEIDLTGEVAEAVNGAVLRGPALVLGYVADDGSPSLSYRGSAQVYSTDQLAVWARKPVEGLAQAITARPTVSLLYYRATPRGPPTCPSRVVPGSRPKSTMRSTTVWSTLSRHRIPIAKGSPSSST